jgi:PTS system mannose-specific IIC component
MVINMMATPDLWPWFFAGFALASITELNLIQMGVIGLVFALIFIQLSPKFNGGGGSGSSGSGGGDDLDAVLNDY